MPRFTPPTMLQSSCDPFFGRYKVPVGQSVVRIDGEFQTVVFPWLGELVTAGREGKDWFLGGRTYTVSALVAASLIEAGYEMDASTGGSGFGTGPFGSGPFGGS